MASEKGHRTLATWQTPRRWATWVLALCLGSMAAGGQAAVGAPSAQAGAGLPYIIGLHEAYLTPDYWADRAPAPDVPMLDAARIAAQNARMRETDPHIQDIAMLPPSLAAVQVRTAVQALSRWPARPLYDDRGTAISTARRRDIEANLGLDGVPASTPLRFGLVVARAALRTFPTGQRVFSAPGDTDIDRFQESALFPGDKVAIIHRSADGAWLFVHSERYSAWIQARYVAIGARDTVLDYNTAGPHRVITAAAAQTAYTPEEPRVSQLRLEMGVRVPLLANWPPAVAVNGQQAHAGWVVQLPVREPDGGLRLVPALLPRSQDSNPGALPLTPRLLLRQAYRFLGERYGWGHDYQARDCSGFVSEVYRSFGVLLPRNTGAQAASPALDRIAFAATDGRRERERAVAALQVGDLVYLPGHVMMVVGRVDGRTWVIHDTAGGGWVDSGGTRVQARLNGVSVTPLEPMLDSDGRRWVDRIVAIQRLRAGASR